MESWFLLIMGPVFLVFIIWEFRYLQQQGKANIYAWDDTLTNVGLALTHQFMDVIAWLGLIQIYYLVYEYRIFTIETTFWGVIALIIGQDFLYYWFHRASHRIRWLWAAHVVHHSSERFNLSTALRQSITYEFAGMWIFWLPLAWLGFEPNLVVFIVGVNLGYQFFVHTSTVGKLGWLETIFNTPMVHRVHHARNPEYIDRNYAGVLVIWDRMFGTYVEEKIDVPCDYGITKQIHSNNIITINFNEWSELLKDVMRPGSVSQRLKHLWSPPEWQRPEEKSAQVVHS